MTMRALIAAATAVVALALPIGLAVQSAQAAPVTLSESVPVTPDDTHWEKPPVYL